MQQRGDGYMKEAHSPKPAGRRPARNMKKTSLAKTIPSEKHSFLIVGVGASAGGLEALGQFFEHMPADCGMAFAVIQHLDPTKAGMLPELLQRTTSMKVMQAKDRTKVRPNEVYVIPPNSDMSIANGILHLHPAASPRGSRLPIDVFFRSLAEDQKENGVGIVLSGMGCDGTLGLATIKENAGLTLVQDPQSAKFDSMPRSAIAAGLGDIVDSADELPGKLIAYRQQVRSFREAELLLTDKDKGSMEKILILLRSHTRHDFTQYRRSTLYRRVERRMGIHKLSTIGAYVRFLRENPQETDLLFKELLIGVTRFFRDRSSWQALGKTLPKLLAGRGARGPLRAWVAGCSTGEEAYSLAILFSEVLRQTKAPDNGLQIYATDLDKDAIDKARQGLFSENIVADVSPARLGRFFAKEGGGYRVNKSIRSMVIFAPQNLIMDPPFTKLDILCCRNLLIYLTPELQKKLFPLFHYSLNPRGIMFLGGAESIGGFSNLFVPLAAKERIFQRCESAAPGRQLDFPAVFVPVPADKPNPSPPERNSSPSIQVLAQKLLQERFAPPAVLVNEQGDIVFFSGHTGQYLEPSAGKASWNVMAMAREGLRYDLASALQRVTRKKSEIVIIRDIKVSTDAASQSVDLVVQWLEEPKELRGMVLIVFSEAVTPKETGPADGPRKTRMRGASDKELERQLLRARDEVQSCREEMQTSQEELKSMNEELQSTNEELQSTNEELTTSKEEMQSLNEELQTVNGELQAKLDELSGTNNDMKNLLNSTDIATVFLDNDLCLRRFTAQAKTIIKFIPSDVGRPITDLASDLQYPALVADAQEVLRTLVFSEKSISTGDGRWFTVRIMPYRTMDNRIEGVVITFSDISAAKKVETKLRQQNVELNTQSAERGRALNQAENRWKVHKARQLKGAGGKPTPKAAPRTGNRKS
jgi:two-component system, chemotaxis family, CheB/CheR fusion protein